MTNAIRPVAGVSGPRLIGLDLLRGFAILLVLLRHSWPDAFGSAGIVGVVTFFALSGYLITGLLARDLRTYGRVRYKRFYLHRVFRLAPALLVLLAGFTIITAVWSPQNDRSSIGKSLFFALTYTMNLPGADKGSPALNHLWTLATEEQFYIVWPVVLAFGARLARTRLVAVVSIVAATIACVGTMIYVHLNVLSIYTWPTSWAVTMLIGALASLEQDRIEGFFTYRPRLRAWFAFAGLVILCGISLIPELRNDPATYIVGGPLIAVSSVALIFWLRRWPATPRRALRPLLALGTISYGAYLWNGAIQYWVGPRPFSAFQSFTLFVLTIAAATTSWWLVEKPLAGIRRRIDLRLASGLEGVSPSDETVGTTESEPALRKNQLQPPRTLESDVDSGREAFFETQLLAGIPLSSTDLESAAERLVAKAREGRSGAVHLVNAYTISLSHSDPDFHRLLHSGSANLPDGKPLTWISRMLHKPVLQVRGPSLFESILALGRETDTKHFLLGSTEATLKMLMRAIEDRFPGARIVGAESPPFREATIAELASQDNRIAESGAQIVWVGLGTPKQDYEVERLARKLPVVAIAIGAAFDFMAGTKKEAPRWLSRLGLEWLFRLMSEPRRLWRRYLVGNFLFLRAVMGARPRRFRIDE